MRLAGLILTALLTAACGTALAQPSKEAACKREAGETNNPTHDAVYKRCMAAAPASKSAPAAAPAKRMTEAECRRMAGEPGNPTYEAVLRKCLGK